MEWEGPIDPIADMAARFGGISPQDLVLAMMDVAQRLGHDVELVKNHVGNLAVMRGDDYLGFVDLRTGHLEVFEP